jgi:biotin-dependent carboxylase-like uncharacterized protein
VVVGAGTLAVTGAASAAVRAVVSAGPPALTIEGRAHTVEMVYDGPDLADVAAALGLGAAEVVARHAEAEYLVELSGFLPGFAYLSGPPGWSLALPRRPSPRPRVAAGSVGIAAAFTAIYPFSSPGGWNLIGRAVSAVPFDPSRDPPVLFSPGDRVRFLPVPALEHAAAESPSPAELGDTPAGGRALVILGAPACATVQDRGRAGQLGRGVPPSGPLDPETFAAANAAVGNDLGSAAVEIPLGALEVEARGGAALVSVDGEAPSRLAEGERLRIPETGRAVRYLAVAGGVDVPVVLGARSTLLVARVGGYLGRPLRRGDLLPVGGGGAGGAAAAAAATVDASSDPLAIDPGPHRDRFPAGAYEALLAGPWEVSRLGDRTGVRLAGARVPREGPDLALPVPMIRGAVEVTTDGTPIVLGPDHPTTGGYPVLAVLRPAAQAALARRRPGAPVRFVDAP